MHKRLTLSALGNNAVNQQDCKFMVAMQYATPITSSDMSCHAALDGSGDEKLISSAPFHGAHAPVSHN